MINWFGGKCVVMKYRNDEKLEKVDVPLLDFSWQIITTSDATLA